MRRRVLSGGGRGLETERGLVSVWVRPPILMLRLAGLGAGGFADPIIDGFDQILAARLEVQLFFEMGGMESYESALRTRLTSHFVAHRTRITSLHVFTRSRLVSMGVAVANLALGGLITSHEDLAGFPRRAR